MYRQPLLAGIPPSSWAPGTRIASLYWLAYPLLARHLVYTLSLSKYILILLARYFYTSLEQVLVYLIKVSYTFYRPY